MDKIAIIGLGLIGGSIGMALKQTNTPNLEIVGHDIEPRTNRAAMKRGAVDRIARRLAEAVEETRVTFRDLSDEEIDLFVEAVRPLDRAGAYTVDGPGSLLVERYEGCYQNVLGLPLVCLDRLLRTIGDTLHSRIRADQAQFL